MKKLALSVILILSIIGIAGCSKRNLKINVEKVSTNTIVAKSDGKLQVATVEDFDKSYYKLAELKEFANKEIDTYNKKSGGNNISVDDIHLNEDQKKAIMVLSYNGMDSYASFNKVPAAYFSGGVTDYPLTIPDSLIDVKNKETVNTKEIIQNKKYKVLIMYEPYEIIVDGKIAYYSKGAEPVSSNEIKGNAKETTVVVYKP